ncbi:hypothetical protein ACFWF7_34160 [Nocardia sp. NPDC060256]|uniref:hypothetical protein n=1 Tax=unclassified Nocardia TaxID=2637762 RepID=UPI0036667C02
MAEAFATVVGPERAEALTYRVLDLMPLEPIDRRTTLHALLTELPKLPETLIPLVREPAPLYFGVPELPDLRAVATMLNLTPAELDWFADLGGWLRTAREPLSHYRYRHVPKSNGAANAYLPWPTKSVGTEPIPSSWRTTSTPQCKQPTRS